MSNDPEKISLTNWLIAIAVMLTTVMEVLDLTIVNVAMPNMMGTLEASTDQITWVLTSYVVASAIFMPLTGFLVNRLGRKRLLLINIVGFLIASILCGTATSLTEMVIFRALQGVFGASLVPLSQFILRDTFPDSQIGKAMAIWGVGIMVGPVLGPTLGGYITDNFNWRWVFYINVPFCIAAFFMCKKLITETPIKKIKMDYLSVALMAVGIGALQVFLDRGNTVDWFSAPSTRWLCFTFITCLTIFVIRGLKIPDNIINLRLFKDRNFSASTFMLTIFGSGIFGTIALQPLLMENLMGYQADTAGLMMAPRGIASAIAMAMAPKLMKHFDIRALVAIGIALCAISTFWLANLNLLIGPSPLIWASVIQGLGMGIFFIPLSAVCFATLPPAAYAEAAGLFSFGRSMGISIGISLLSTLLTRQSQTNWNRFNANIRPTNPNFQAWIANHHLTGLSYQQTLAVLSQQVSQQATMMGFINCFWAVTLSFIIMLPLVFLLKKPANISLDNMGH